MSEGVGVIGLGNIGNGVAKNFAKSRWPLTVWDIDPKKRKPFEGMANVTVAPPVEMARTCGAIVFLVQANPQIRECTDGKDGIFANAKKGLLLLDLTSSYPADTQKISREAARKKIFYIDAGTSGGPTRADTGELLLMVGGDKKGFELANPYFKAIAKHIYYLGPSGSGHTLKLIHNNLTYINFLAACEAGRQAERAGIAIADMINIFNNSNARSYATEDRFPRHILNKKWDGRGSIKVFHKDLTLAVKLCKQLGADDNLTRATLGFFDRALNAGMGPKDYTLVYRDYEKLRKVPRAKKARVR
jgi:3-hydroxyisobutyrate dehydrogenase